MIILGQSQEHADQAVAVDIVGLPGLEEHVGFVEEEDRAPGMRDVHDAVEILFQRLGVRAKFACADGVQRALEVLCDGLACEGFSHSGWTVEHDVEPLAFTLYDVVDCLRGVEAVRGDEAAEILLNARGQHEGGEGLSVPLDVVDAGEGELEPEFLGEGEA